jgi:ABC-type transporter Mla subunit MlaD
VPFQEILILIALITWTLVGAGLLHSLLFVAPQIRRTFREIDRVTDAINQQALPVIEQSEQILEQMSRVSTVLVTDVEVVDRTIVRAAESLERIVELAEERVTEVNALVSVAVEEAEETFLSTAGLLRALRLGRGRRKRRIGIRERRRFG